MTPTPVSERPAPTLVDGGLYRLKPWYAARLTPVLELLLRYDVSPDAVSALGVIAAGAGGAVLAFAEPGPVTAVAVLFAVAVRLGCANLDGSLARRRTPRRFGAVVNEIGDRLGDLLVLAGLTVHLAAPLGWSVLLAACVPSWIALAAAAAGASRRNGGPVGKTERAALCVVAALTGLWGLIGAIVLLGSLATAWVRLRATAIELATR